MAVLESEVEIACEPPRLFGFVNDPANRPRVSPPNVNVELVEAPDAFSEGARLTFVVQAYGQKQRFLHEIVEWEEHVGFTERQVQGPFAKMVHRRDVVESPRGTKLVEQVAFEPPGGLLGFLLTEARIREMLGDGFRHQHRELRRLLEPST